MWLKLNRTERIHFHISGRNQPFIVYDSIDLDDEPWT